MATDWQFNIRLYVFFFISSMYTPPKPQHTCIIKTRVTQHVSCVLNKREGFPKTGFHTVDHSLDFTIGGQLAHSAVSQSPKLKAV